MNWISIALLVLIAAGFFAAVRASRKNGCGGNCSGCSLKCGKKKDNR